MLVHEQNRVPGMTNRLLTRFAVKVLQGFPGTFPCKESALDCGNPVRREVALGDGHELIVVDFTGHC